MDKENSFAVSCEGRAMLLRDKSIIRFKSIILDTSIFRIVYLITLFLEMIAFINVVALALRCIVLAWGAVILVNNFFVTPRAFTVKHNTIIWAFIAIGLITSFWNFSKALPENLVFVYHSIVCFFIFYGMYSEKEHKKLEKEMLFLLTVFVFLSTFFAILSLGVLIFKAQINIGSYYLGIFRNRLIGVYTNQNLLAFSMVVSIVSCDILRDKYIKENYPQKSIPSWASALCIFINFLSLFLSDSNASFVFIIIYFTVRIFYKSLSAYSSIGFRQFIREGASLIVCCVTMIAGSFVARNTCQDMISLLLNDVHKIEEPITDDAPNISPSQSPVNTYMPDVSIGRENYDISSGRITLFKQGLKLFMINPVIGIGRGNLVYYGEKYLDGGLIFSELHNAYLTILVSYGAVGFLLFLIFAVLVGTSICRYLFRSVYIPSASIFNKLFAILAAYCAYSVFEKGILSEITFMVVFFWLILGYTFSYKEYEEKNYNLYDMDNY